MTMELSEGSEFSFSLLNNSPNPITVINSDTSVKYVNRALEKLTGFSRQELIGSKAPYSWWTKETLHKTSRDFKKAMRKGARKVEELFQKKNGERFWAEITSIPVKRNGRFKYYLSSWVDITQRKRTEKELEKLNKELLRSNKKLRQLTMKDAHTGLYNHIYFEDAIEAEFHRAKRFGHPLSVIMIDLDYFKSINEVYGHRFGDLVLKQFARQLKRLVRPYDIVIRFGGEEFVIITSGLDRVTALTLAKRLQDAINLYNFGDKNNSAELKLSVAIVSYPEDNNIKKGMDFIELADQILNKAKEHGGDCVYSSIDIGKKKTPVSEEGKERNDIKFLTEKIDKLTKKANQSLIESVFAFAKTIKLKDRHTGEHVERAVQYATEIAENLGLTKEEIERIRQAAILHDLGKIGIREKVLLKKGKLTKKEFAEIKKHPQIGVDIIRPIQFLHNIIPLILFHHERWDGKGYPKGLKGEEIPLGARIVAISDVYQALISDRPYRKAFSKKEAIGIIKEGSGTQFDSKIVSAFLKILRKKKNTKI